MTADDPPYYHVYENNNNLHSPIRVDKLLKKEMLHQNNHRTSNVVVITLNFWAVYDM